MAISESVYRATRAARQRNLLPQGGTILEFGQANWHNMPLGALFDDIAHMDADEACKRELNRRLWAIYEGYRRNKAEIDAPLFAIARIFYEVFYAPRAVEAIDYNGIDSHKLDLNGPIDLGRQFDVCIDNGTAEHVFNIGQVFRTMHDHTRPGGVMIHDVPFTGHIDHGFYGIHSTLFFDLCLWNGYDMLSMSYIDADKVVDFQHRDDIVTMMEKGEIARDSHWFVILRRPPTAEPFRVPVQGIYTGAIPERNRLAWK